MHTCTQVSDRLDVMTAMGKASASRLRQAALASTVDDAYDAASARHDLNASGYDARASVPRRARAAAGGGVHLPGEVDEHDLSLDGSGAGLASHQLQQGMTSGPEPPATPTTQMLAATADILSAVAARRRLQPADPSAFALSHGPVMGRTVGAAVLEGRAGLGREGGVDGERGKAVSLARTMPVRQGPALPLAQQVPSLTGSL